MPALASSLPRSRALPLPPSDAIARRFCTACDIGAVCLAADHAAALRALHARIEHTGSYRPGHFLFREGDPLAALAVVRTGAVKLCVIEPGGGEQVVGLALPGDAIGLDAFDDERHHCSAVVLESTTLCRLPVPLLERLSTVPAMQRVLLALFSRHLARADLLGGRFGAERRMAAFLVAICRHAARRGLSGTRVHLPMARIDIANYLGLTPETVSRVLRRWREGGVVDIRQREVAIRDPGTLADLARPILRR